MPTRRGQNGAWSHTRGRRHTSGSPDGPVAGSLALPEPFVRAAREWLGDEADAFLEACARPPRLALRANGLKGGLPALLQALGHDAGPSSPVEAWPRVPWWPEALLPPLHEVVEGLAAERLAAERLAVHPLARIGALYAQDPAALAAVAALDPRPGERVLDLCAAPGGKSTAIADRMAAGCTVSGDAPRGLLVANDVEPRRARELARTMERWGVTHGAALALPSERLVALAPGLFDRVLVDAPCSGEAMFGRRARAAADWSPGHVDGCAARQERLLAAARRLVRPAGLLVYATCTFNPRENEAVVAAYLAAHPEDALEDAVARVPGALPGRPDLLPDRRTGPHVDDLARCARLWPHRVPGGGHFVAIIRVAAGPDRPVPGAEGRIPRARARVVAADTADAARTAAGVAPRAAFLAQGRPVSRGERAFVAPIALPAELEEVALAPGVEVAERRGRTWRPAHALAMALRPADADRAVDLDGRGAAAFLQGEPIADMDAGSDGLLLAAWHGYPLGWARVRYGALTPLLPRGLRAAGLSQPW